ncbi:hypothetical protein [uncultured Desulfuromusa sp.]|uniref:hypothetical protein n=1 Tax=uncultured Desulfuromusa sp. TaxID=219183 RepID=UPI002AA5F6E6|nr:hypothetical protein [uncultured Desulfuromusa sp.]
MKRLSCNMNNGINAGSQICYAISLLTLFILIAQTSVAKGTMLESADCGKCHAVQLKIITQDGGKHATEVGCLDCHPQHPPVGTETKTPCISCHDGEPHFEIGNCQHCHTNPHQPMSSLRDPLKPARKECLSCHFKVGQQMEAAPSRHAKIFCNRCHSQHKEIPSCLDCHEPHSSRQRTEDCSKCHPAHQPLKIEPTGYIPATLCRPCHGFESNALAESNTSHGGINCINCHKGRHPSVPTCQDCHGLPHTQSIHSQFRDCLECHGDAHQLISNQ